jgi:hypothetical protein
MRLICPHCMSGVTVPDDAAGQDATCPNCGKAFPTPARYSAEVMSPPAPPPVPAVAPPPRPVASEVTTPAATIPPAPPGYVPPLPPVAPSGFLPTPNDAPATPHTPAAEGYTKSVGVTISPKVVAWLPALLLTVVFVLTFFPWVGCYAGGSPVYSQRPWGAMFNLTPVRNFKLEGGTIPGGWLDKKRGDWQLLLPFFLALILGVVFAWAERGLGALDPRRVPPLAKLWPWRNAVVAGCAGLALVLLLTQWAYGFGLERAIKQHVAEQFAGRREQAAASPEALGKLEYDQEQEFNRYGLEHTTWFYLALVSMLGAVAAVVTRVALDNRGHKPPPRLVLHY